MPPRGPDFEAKAEAQLHEHTERSFRHSSRKEKDRNAEMADLRYLKEGETYLKTAGSAAWWEGYAYGVDGEAIPPEVKRLEPRLSMPWKQGYRNGEKDRAEGRNRFVGTEHEPANSRSGNSTEEGF